MLPFGIGFSEVLLILVVVLLVVGPAKLPEIARTVGKGLRTVRRAGNELRDAIAIEDIKRDVMDGPRRAWQEATRIDDVEPGPDGTYAPLAEQAPPPTTEPRAEAQVAAGPVARTDPFAAAMAPEDEPPTGAHAPTDEPAGADASEPDDESADERTRSG